MKEAVEASTNQVWRAAKFPERACNRPHLFDFEPTTPDFEYDKTTSLPGYVPFSTYIKEAVRAARIGRLEPNGSRLHIISCCIGPCARQFMYFVWRRQKTSSVRSQRAPVLLRARVLFLSKGNVS